MITGLHTHGQFVSEIPGRGLAHAGDPEMLPHQGGLLYVKVVEGHHKVNFPAPENMRRTLNDGLVSAEAVLYIFEVKELIYALPWPGLVL
ncbi:hypothetical protein D9M69_559720 [compost metagenome]